VHRPAQFPHPATLPAFPDATPPPSDGLTSLLRWPYTNSATVDPHIVEQGCGYKINDQPASLPSIYPSQLCSPFSMMMRLVQGALAVFHFLN
jgi:hypothetical protein